MDFNLPEFIVNSKQTVYCNLWYKEILQIDKIRDLTKDIDTPKVCILDNTAKITNDTLSHNVVDIWEFTSEKGEAGLHGHHVAGIIACKKYGMSPNVKIGTFKVLTSGQGYGMTQWVVAGIKKAQELGYTIINASLGGDYEDKAIKDAVEEFCSKGGYFICASGNDGKETDYPAAWANEIEGVFAIGATRWDYDNKRIVVSAYSSSGTVSFVMPGDLILSTLPNNQYGELTGTSMAAPFFTGLVANILGVNPKITKKGLIQLCAKYSTKVDESNYKQGQGFANIYEILLNAKEFKFISETKSSKTSLFKKILSWLKRYA